MFLNVLYRRKHNLRTVFKVSKSPIAVAAQQCSDFARRVAVVNTQTRFRLLLAYSAKPFLFFYHLVIRLNAHSIRILKMNLKPTAVHAPASARAQSFSSFGVAVALHRQRTPVFSHAGTFQIFSLINLLARLTSALTLDSSVLRKCIERCKRQRQFTASADFFGYDVLSHDMSLLNRFKNWLGSFGVQPLFEPFSILPQTTERKPYDQHKTRSIKAGN
jgi:hypothetical protein